MSNPGRFPFIRALSPDLNGWGFFLCTQKDVRQGRSGDLYISLSLQDKTGLVRARIFNDAARLRDEFDNGEFVKVQGRTDLFNGRVQLLVEKIRRINPDQDKAQGFREEDCVLCAARPIEEMWGELQELIQHVRDPHVRELLQKLATEHADKLRIWPAAQTVHHAYRSGFLEHILSVARSALTLGTIYGANQDLLTAGALLHDIGKLEELDYDRSTSYSREGNLVGHVTLGTMMVRAAMMSIPEFPDLLRTQIEHLIVSHHGQKEFGAPVEPMTIEAMILSAADDLDAKINQVRQALAEEGEGEFTPYHSRLGRVLWRG
ncbi:MAG TPA: HD domain-containing protein [Vicinamibacterales bacterium]|nr:HD domain-containing protein [Vicinamibacterales bacterium]